MEITNTVVLVTGANRGLGRCLVEAVLERGVRRVYAGVRAPGAPLPGDPRVVPVTLDITEPDQIEAAARTAPDVQILINNASTAQFADLLSAGRDAVLQEMATNYVGTFDMIRAFVPVLEQHPGAAIVNVLSLLSLASAPPMAGYSASKAAAHSMTQALRPLLAARGIAVYGAYPAGIDTDMLAGVEGPKTPPKTVANGILDGLEQGRPDIFPDPNSEQMSKVWFADPKAFERAFSGEEAA